VRDGFRMIRDAQEDIEVVGEAADGLEAIAKGPRARSCRASAKTRQPCRRPMEQAVCSLGEGQSCRSAGRGWLFAADVSSHCLTSFLSIPYSGVGGARDVW
jgi:hypothetical protein